MDACTAVASVLHLGALAELLSVMVQPDVLEVAISDAFGGLSLNLTLPNSSAIAGLVYHEQVVSFAATPVEVTGSNGLTRTIGAL